MQNQVQDGYTMVRNKKTLNRGPPNSSQGGRGRIGKDQQNPGRGRGRIQGRGSHSPTKNAPPMNALPITSIFSEPPSVIPKYVRNKTTLRSIKDDFILNQWSFKRSINDMKGNKTSNMYPKRLQQEFTRLLNKLNLTEHECTALGFSKTKSRA